MSGKLTPIRKQYLEIKSDYPDAILFFRLGDFYETFDEDAKTAAEVLDIVLTSRNVAKGDRVPMAGIPHHAADGYIAKLVERGFHVAICEQIGDGPVKGLFPREVVRVITPGTVLEPALLKGDHSNYLLAVIQDGPKLGLAYADISTGEFSAGQFEDHDIESLLESELVRLAPAEVLVPDDYSVESIWAGNTSTTESWRFEEVRAAEKLKEHFGAATLDGFGLGGFSLAVRAAGALIDYLARSQQSALHLLTTLSRYSLDDFMVLDAETRRNLELTATLRGDTRRGSLFDVLDETVTPMGRRLLQQWLNEPLLAIDQIEERLDQVTLFFDGGLWRAEIRAELKGFHDLERLANRIAAGVARPRDLTVLRENLARLPDLRSKIEAQAGVRVFEQHVDDLDPCQAVFDLLTRAIEDDPPATLGNIGVIKPGFSEELDEVIESSEHARKWIADLEKVERERTGIKSLKVGFNKVFGYYIEVTKANTGSVPEEYIRKQTLVNAERYITPEMKDYEAKVLSAEDAIRAIETRLFHEICRTVSEDTQRLIAAARAMARFDAVAALAEVAANKNYVRPELFPNQCLEIEDGRHPVVEEQLVGRRFIPNDILLEEGERIRIITGPNMSGKSTYLRQVALIVLMAQMGSFVPAAAARIGLVDRIFTRIGAQDEIFAGQSTFMVEMVETANILHNATPRSLLILDEIGRGTSTYDGVSIAWAVVEYVHNHPRLRSRTLFATHYHELTSLSAMLPGVRNYNVAVSEEGGEVVFLHKITRGGADKSYGIHVAELAGLPRPVINRAQEILAQFEMETGGPTITRAGDAEQLRLFPEQGPLMDELKKLDLDVLSPLEALNRLYEWKQRFYPDGTAGEDGG
ncbi:MAG: DNA mismatch repair protein MutS [Anaerolineales bacterium]|nr:DNA mismatch repair protein MutS [Anaerolineales bacterium]